MRIDTRTVTLRLVVVSRDFTKRRPVLKLNIASQSALADAEKILISAGFRVIKANKQIVDEGPIDHVDIEGGVANGE